MNNIKWNKKMTSMFLIVMSLFIFIFFTRGYYGDYIYANDKLEANNAIYNKKIEELWKISKIKKDLNNLRKWKVKEIKAKEFKDIKKYLQPGITEDKIIREIYWIANRITNGEIKISSISMTQWVKNELWFKEVKIIVSARVNNYNVVKSFLNFLLYNSKYKVFITSFDLPTINKIDLIKQKSFMIQVPITVFYVDKIKK